ncbi:MAG: hypothetical protein K2Q22_04985, partial [Cytophagales bacterium]|nr:hypothetical protein [Cytophagales bacterium]
NRKILTPDQVPGSPDAPNFQTTASSQGYVINPFLSSHYQLGLPLPVISGLKTFVGSFANGVSGAIPPSNTDFNVQATITQSPGTGTPLSFVGATLNYTTDPISNGNPTWIPVPMYSTFQGNDYYGSIPGFPEGTLVRYFVTATNSGVGPNNKTNLPSPKLAKYYIVRDAGLSISDLQYTPYSDGNSIFAGANGLAGQIVTVTGVVTSSIKDLGVVYIQQENVTEWGGITVFPQNAISNNPAASIAAALAKLKRGQKVTIIGGVSETFSQTTLNATKVITLPGVGNITPIRLQAETFSNSDQEKYEGMLVTLVNQPFQKIKVIDPKFVGSRGTFKVGSASSNSSDGTSVMTGVQDGRYQVWTYSSMNTNYLRSKNREFNGNDGILGANIATVDTVSTA